MSYKCSDCGKEVTLNPEFVEEDLKRISLQTYKVLLCQKCFANRFRNSEQVKNDKKQIEEELKRL